jgi:hypothetical protein
MKAIRMAALAAVALLLLSAVGAQDSPNDLPAYATLEEAGVHAIQRAYECSHYYECGGVIAQRPDGKFVVGPVESDGDGTSVSIRHSVPSGWKEVASYHTHPCLTKTHLPSFFSPQDIEGDVELRETGFLGDLCTGDVHEFTPGRDSPNDAEAGLDTGVWLTHGRIIGHITVDNTVIEPNTGL